MKPLASIIAVCGIVLLSDQLGGRGHLTFAAEPNDPGVVPAVSAVNGFAFDFYGHLVQQDADRNIFFSPFSISTVLTMAAEGARDVDGRANGQGAALSADLA